MTNKFRFTLFAMAAALGLFSCSDKLTDDGLANNRPEDDGNYVYINASIALPTASGMRSATDEDGDTNSDGAYNGENRGDDFEYGYDYENDVRSLLLVFADKDYKYVAHSVVKGITQAPTTNTKFDFTATGEVKHAYLEEAYKQGILNGTDDVKVYAFCNYTADLLQKLDTVSIGSTSWVDEKGTVVEAASPAGHTPNISNTIWANRSFLMSNAQEAPVAFPKTIDEWDAYADKNTPYDITDKPIKVERTAARIDFRDGSSSVLGTDNTYDLWAIQKVTTTTTEGDGDDQTTTSKTEIDTLNLFSVQLTRMALVNMSKDYYYLRRVSHDGTDTDWVINGVESPDTSKTAFVVDTDWETKQAEKGYTAANANTGFNFPLYKADESYNMDGWYVDNISAVLDVKNSNDTWNGKNTYKIWRYVTENTIPTVEQQKTVQSTGVIFKGAIIAGQDADGLYPKPDGDDTEEYYVSKAVREALAASKEHKADYDYPILYSFNNMLYAGIDGIVAAAKAEGYNSPIYYAVDSILCHWYKKDGNYVYSESIEKDSLSIAVYDTLSVEKKNAIDFCGTDSNGKANEDKEYLFMKHAPKNNITIYKASNENDGEGWGYYCYYFYWNRHNDNNKSGKMGHMEFATVRNNVYKLAVTKISQLGHPRVTNYDPDPVEPEDPDEEETNYIKVQVEVLPWVVRVNDIEF